MEGDLDRLKMNIEDQKNAITKKEKEVSAKLSQLAKQDRADEEKRKKNEQVRFAFL